MRWRPALLVAATATGSFVCALVAYAVWPEGESKPVRWVDLTAKTGRLLIPRETKRVFEEHEVLERYLAGNGGRMPNVDFSRSQVLLVSPGPRSSTGYEVEIIEARERDGKLTVTVRELTPGLDEDVQPGVTFPYRLLALPAGKPVYVDWPGR